ncbi:BrnT family toxin [Thalassospira lucentensis]|uniref:BrnT family toxin n=1 Tax=Thalassospira lucentensis TaxID=168935 RepID=UPI0003B5B92F|nr:BrnT family toxin [Thalassospira lucentensis]RCK28902.1 hypothetical protein TH1_07190 [Thalassospira lucentensis MCCC 1A00383 = DSM 14000]
MYEWDDSKNKLNAEKHGVAFEQMERFDWDTAFIIPDDRHTELRWFAIGFIGHRVYAVAFAERGDKVRIISLRKANKREQKRYSDVQT